MYYSTIPSPLLPTLPLYSSNPFLPMFLPFFPSPNKPLLILFLTYTFFTHSFSFFTNNLTFSFTAYTAHSTSFSPFMPALPLLFHSFHLLYPLLQSLPLLPLVYISSSFPLISPTFLYPSIPSLHVLQVVMSSVLYVPLNFLSYLSFSLLLRVRKEDPEWHAWKRKRKNEKEKKRGGRVMNMWKRREISSRRKWEKELIKEETEENKEEKDETREEKLGEKRNK